MPNVVASPVIHREEQATVPSIATPRNPTPVGRLRVDRIEDVAGFAALCYEWGALLERSGERSPFLTWEWLYPWWQHMGGERELYLLAVRNSSGALVGLAPLCRSWTGLGPWGRCRALEFLGTGKAASEYLNVIVDPAEGCVVLAALVEYLADHRDEWDVLTLSDVDEKAWSLSMMRLLFRLNGFDAVVSLTPGSQCRYARLDDGWESYLRARSAKLRYQIKQKGGALEGRHGARFVTLDRAAEIPRAMERLIALHRNRLATIGKVSTLLDESMVAFLHGTTPLLFERGWLRLCALVAGGRPLAMVYGLAYRGGFYDYQKGMDIEWAKWGVGTVLQARCIEHACAEGLIEYDLLRGDESYKDRWASYTKHTMRLDIVQRGPRTWSYRGTRRLIQGIRAVRQRVRSVMWTR